jgi:branched-chain amino acid transport system substrate-binding protein
MKYRYALSLLFVLSLIISACGGAPATEAPAATQAPAAEPTATTAPAPEPTATTAAAAPAAGGGVKVALLAPMTGQVSTFGVSTKNGVDMAVAEWNANGGVAGQQIELVVEDSQCSPEPAVNAANVAIDQEGAKFIIGEVCSSASIPVSQIADAKHVLQISPTSTNPGVTVDANGNVKPYVFRACFIDPFQGTVGANFALKTLKAKTAFIMLDQGNDYVRGLAEFFEKAFTEGGGQIVGKETYTSQDTDFSAILSKVAEAKPDVLYLPDYYPIVNLVGAQVKERGLNVTMVGGDGWDSADLDRKAADGGYYTNHYSPEDTRPIVQDWVKKYTDKYGAAPDALATLGYDAANMLFTAMKNANSTDPDKVKDALASLKDFVGVSGNISMDAQHNPVKSAVVLQVKDGQIKFVESVTP